MWNFFLEIRNKDLTSLSVCVYGLLILNTYYFIYYLLIKIYETQNKDCLIPTTILSTSTDCCSLYVLHPAVCWCTDFPFRKGKPVCYAGEFQRKGDNRPAARLSLCYNSADKTTDPYLHAESARHHAERLHANVMQSAHHWLCWYSSFSVWCGLIRKHTNNITF